MTDTDTPIQPQGQSHPGFDGDLGGIDIDSILSDLGAPGVGLVIDCPRGVHAGKTIYCRGGEGRTCLVFETGHSGGVIGWSRRDVRTLRRQAINAVDAGGSLKKGRPAEVFPSNHQSPTSEVQHGV